MFLPRNRLGHYFDNHAGGVRPTSDGLVVPCLGLEETRGIQLSARVGFKSFTASYPFGLEMDLSLIWTSLTMPMSCQDDRFWKDTCHITSVPSRISFRGCECRGRKTLSWRFHLLIPFQPYLGTTAPVDTFLGELFKPPSSLMLTISTCRPLLVQAELAR